MIAHRTMQIVILLIAIFSLTKNSNAAEEKYQQKCVVDYNQMLNLSPREFDQNWEKGWVKLAEMGSCKEAAANVIALYYSQRDLPESAVKTLKFHEAQLRAEIEQYDLALLLFPQTKKGESSIGWNHYVDGTIAFLVKDEAGLDKAIKRLAAVPKPASFNPVDADGNAIDVPWPPNLKVLQRFEKCFDATYLEAYAGCKDE